MQLWLMEIKLDELMTIHSALVNVKKSLSQERKIDADKLLALVDEAYEVVMKKIDSFEQPFFFLKLAMVKLILQSLNIACTRVPLLGI